MLNLYKDKKLDDEQISIITGTRSSVIKKYIIAYNEGKSEEAKKYYGKKLSIPDLCKLYGIDSEL